jgi:hypothetical protein
MNELFARIGNRTSGFILLAITAGLAAFAGMTIYAAVFRWMAVADLRECQLCILGRDHAAALAAARAAAQAQPGNAVAVLPSLDLARDEDARTLDRFLARARAPQRETLLAGAGLALALHGKPAGEVPGDDGALLAYLATLAGNPAAPPPMLAGDAPPHRGILSLALLRRFQAAWTLGNAAAIREAAGALLLLDPRQVDAGRLRVLLIVLAGQPGALSPTALGAQIASLVPEGGARLALLRQLGRLAPAHLPELSAIIPPDQQSAEERAAGQLASTGRLDDLVKAVLLRPDEDVLRSLLPRALGEGRLDLARPMLALLRADHRPAFEAALAQADGDLATLVRLGGDATALQPRITTPLIANGRLSFHLATASGVIPHAAVEVRIDGRALAADKVARYGSLVVAELGGATTTPYEVLLAGKVVAGGRLGQ